MKYDNADDDDDAEDDADDDDLIPLLPLESETVLLKSKAWDQPGQGLRPLTVSEP